MLTNQDDDTTVISFSTLHTMRLEDDVTLLLLF